MKWFGTAMKVEQFDDGDRLRFRVTSERRLGILIIPFAAAIGLVYAWHVEASWLMLLGMAALVGVPIWRWLQVRVTELRVTELELVAEGDLNNGADTLWLQWSEVSGLQHYRGDEGGPDGLYALQGIWDRVCVLPDVNIAQADQIIRAIYSRFPYVAMAEGVETPSIFGKRSEPITFGLTKQD
jgi:hypothetical protein